MKEKMNLEILKIRFKSHYVVGFFLIAFVTAALYLHVDYGGGIAEEKEYSHRNKRMEHDVSSLNIVVDNETTVTSCDLSKGRWIYDNVSRPLYKEGQCRLMLEDFACEKYGRKDVEYQKWRWQPHDCDLPRFNGTIFLEKIRGKRLVFVGDSLNRNQWMSLLCLIESSLDPSSDQSFVRKDNIFSFKATEYNATIEFYWSPLLVESNCDDIYSHSIKDRTVRITSIEKHARYWTDADILIFDTFIWWLQPTMTLLWGSFGSSDAVYKRVEMKLRRYEMALNTWSDWLEFNINRTKTKLFFMSFSPYHSYGKSWDDQRSCYKETEPVLNDDYRGACIDQEMMNVVESVLHKLETRGVNVTYLNITKLSDYRKDGHPSIYRMFFHPLSNEQLSNPVSYSDCVHWCLPGVPDVWNEMLYSYIIDN